MCNFQEISVRLKELAPNNSNKKKILDKDIAKMLALEPQYYATIKKRNKIPYEAIAIFCMENKISMNWVLLNQKPKYLT